MRPAATLLVRGGMLALCASVLSGCPKKKEEPTVASASAAVSAEPAPLTTRQAQPAPPDVDASDILEDAGCGEKATGDICRILGEFAEGQKWKPTIPSGRGVWVGKSHTIGKEAPGELIALRLKTVPTAQVGPSDLPVMIGFEPLPSEHRAAGEKLFRALQRGGQGKLSNPALPFLEDRFIPRAEFGAMQSEGASTKLLSNDDVYIRKLSLKKIALVKLAAAAPGKDDVSGEVAELWSAVW
jgi:hypothetical protein